MSLFVWQRTITDENGRVVPNAQVEVRDQVSSSLVQLYKDIDGNDGLGNPFNADSDGFARFYVPVGRYRITASVGEQARTWENVRLGTLGTDIRIERTAAEISAGVTPSNYSYPIGDLRRYGAVADGVTDCSPAYDDAISAGWGEIILPAGDFYFSEQISCASPDALRAIKGAGRQATRLLFATGVSGLNIDREFFTLSGLTIRPESGGELQADTIGVVTTRNFIVLRELWITQWDVGQWLGARYYQKSDQVVATLNNINLRVGSYEELPEPNQNTFIDCAYQGANEKLLEQTNGQGNSFVRCDFEGGAGTIDLHTNHDNDTWGIHIKGGNRTVFDQCWIEQCRWAIEEEASRIWFTKCRLFGGHGNGGVRNPRVFIDNNDGFTTPNLMPVANASLWASSAGVTLASSAMSTFTLGGDTKRVRYLAATVDGASSVTKTVTADCTMLRQDSVSTWYPGAEGELHFFVGFYLAKETSDEDDDVTFSLTFYDESASEIYSEGTYARMSLPILQDRTRSGDSDADRGGWQYVGGFYHLRANEGVGDVVRSIRLTIRVGATAKDYSSSNIQVWIAEPQVRLVGQESSVILASALDAQSD